MRAFPSSSSGRSTRGSAAASIAWRVGWPAYELRVAWRAGELAWEIETDGHGAAIATAALRALYPGVSIERSSERDPAPAAVATGRLTGPAGWPVREVDAPEARPVRALAAALEHAPRGTEVRLRCLARPVPPERWRRDGATIDDDASPSILGFLVRTVADAILLHPVADPAPKRPAARLTRGGAGRRGPPPEGRGRLRRRALARGRRHRRRRPPRRCCGGSSASRPPSTTAPRRSAGRSVGVPRRPDLPRGSRTGSSRSCGRCPMPPSTGAGFARVRPLGAAPPAMPAAAGLVLGTSRGRDLALSADALARHLAVFGSTGSGKSTLLLNLVGALAASPDRGDRHRPPRRPHGRHPRPPARRPPRPSPRPAPGGPRPPARVQLPRAPHARRGAAGDVGVRGAVRGPLAAVLRPEDAALPPARPPDAAGGAGARDDHRAHPRPDRRRLPGAARR